MPLPLETERLIIRPTTLEDADDLHEVLSDPLVMRWIPAGPSPSLDETRTRLGKRLTHQDEHGFSLWSIVEKETGDVIGSCGLFLVEGVGPEVELAYHLLRSRWRMGYITEAAEACVDFGFSELGLDRILGLTYPDNFVSRRVLEKVGMTYEGPVEHYGTELVQYSISALDEPA